MKTDISAVFRRSLALILLATLVAGCWYGQRTPRTQKLADCTNSVINFRLMLKTDPDYQLIIGVPFNTNGLDFRGAVIFSQSTGTVARVPISSADSTWYGGKRYGAASEYLLTYTRTNRGERLQDFLVKGQTYDVTVQFSNMPPPGSALWFKSIGKIGFY